MPFKKFWNLAPDNSDEGVLNMYVYGEICSASSFFGSDDDVVASNFVADLNNYPGVRKINVHINSGGGSVFGGIAIYNILKRHNAEIIVYVEGLAASIASVIAMAGDKIIIPENNSTVNRGGDMKNKRVFHRNLHINKPKDLFGTKKKTH